MQLPFSVVDLICLLIVLIFAIIACAKGFIDAIFNKLCWILGLVFSFIFYEKLSNYMIKLITNPVVSKVVSFVLIFVVVFLFVKIIQTIISKAFEGDIMKGLDKSLGFLFGMVEGLAIVLVIILILDKQPWYDTTKLFEGSIFYKLYAALIPSAQKLIEQKETANV